MLDQGSMVDYLASEDFADIDISDESIDAYLEENADYGSLLMEGF